MNNYPLLSLINSPEDLRLLNKDQLPQLCQELRSYLLESVSQTSGHLASGLGTVELTGATRDCSLLLVPEAKVGDWLLVHAGFAVQIVDEEEAQKTLEAFKELEELEEAYFAGKAEQC